MRKRQQPEEPLESDDLSVIESTVFDVPRSPVIKRQERLPEPERKRYRPPPPLVRGHNWTQIYHEYVQGDSVAEIAANHNILKPHLIKVIKENGWDKEQARMFRVIQDGIKDRLEDLAIEEAERTVRAHFSIINKALMRTVDLLPQIRDPRAAKEFASALDILTKAQRLAVGITNYITDPSKGTTVESEAADDLDRALGILEAGRTQGAAEGSES